MRYPFPKIYPILDSSVIPAAGREEFLLRLGGELAAAGVMLLQYRNKTGTDSEILNDGSTLRAAMPAPVRLILDDRADLVNELEFDGVHVDAGDVSAEDARRMLGKERIVGTFGGSTEFLPGILAAPVDYWAVGPIYRTTTKQTDKTPIGSEGVRRMRELAGPDRVLTCAGGITLETAPLVLAAGATSVAVAAAIFRAPDPAAEFRRWKAELG